MNIDVVVSLDFDWGNETDFKLVLSKNDIFHEDEVWQNTDSVYGFFEVRPNLDQITKLVEVLSSFEIINESESKRILDAKPTRFQLGGVL